MHLNEWSCRWFENSWTMVTVCQLSSTRKETEWLFWFKATYCAFFWTVVHIEFVNGVGAEKNATEEHNGFDSGGHSFWLLLYMQVVSEQL